MSLSSKISNSPSVYRAKSRGPSVLSPSSRAKQVPSRRESHRRLVQEAQKQLAGLTGEKRAEKLRELHPREWAIFQQIDVNSDGFVSRDELRLMCQKLGIHPDAAKPMASALWNSIVESREANKEHAVEVDTATSTKKGTGPTDEEAGASFESMLEMFAEISAVRNMAREKQWRRTMGIGVAGNVAGHMAMAGEANADAPAANTPAALFAFYLPEVFHGRHSLFESGLSPSTSYDYLPSSRTSPPTTQEAPSSSSATTSPPEEGEEEDAAPKKGSLKGKMLLELDDFEDTTAERVDKLEEIMNVDTQPCTEVEQAMDRLHRFPVTNAVIDYPREGGKVQVEPEVALYCDILYNTAVTSTVPDSDNPRHRQVFVERLVPRKIAAFNDCSIRQLDGSTKLSEKKNWGHGSKGISLDSFPLLNPEKDFSPEGIASRLALTSYVKRDGKVFPYTQSAPARNYLSFYQPLLNWIRDQMNHQSSVDKWEDMNQLLEASDYPMSCWIALGAGEYTDWGMNNFIKPKDETVVIVYDEAKFPEGPQPDRVAQLFEDHGHVQDKSQGLVALHQTFVQE
ncbi:unnamed protein product [Amoebophrya sp. A25]|nr:unnamed protein product [Amoebophrya sp. A25]|eukprot:GSA25T00018057001.1